MSALRKRYLDLVFSRPYLCDGQAVSCLSSSVCLSVCHECTVAKHCEIQPRLLLITKRKSHIGFQMT